MPLIVPVLRLAYVFLNVFDTFKTLKRPPVSSRDGGRPSSRAMSQRKRAMKGCMTVWLVWVCFVIYERTIDQMVRLFVPFYDEFKSGVILFFLLTRARGAEPIFLHVLRPFIKPYAEILDPILDVIFNVGDFVLLAASLPFHIVIYRYRKWRYPDAVEDSSRDSIDSQDVATPRAARTTNGKTTRRPDEASSVQVEGTTRSRVNGPRVSGARNNTAAIRDAAQNMQPRPAVKRGDHSGIPKSAANTMRASTRQREPMQPAPPPYQVWYPPESPFDPPTAHFTSGPPLAPPSFESARSAGLAADTANEWRQYPPFPSAYPATPLPAPPRQPSHYSEADTTFLDLPEDSNLYATPPGLPAEVDSGDHTFEQGFQRSFPSKREHLHPDSVDDSSDIHDDSEGSREDEYTDDAMDVIESDSQSQGDSQSQEDSDEEDEFNVTLQTPMPKSRQHGPPTKRPLTSGSQESLASRTTSFTTSDNASLFTRTNSRASSKYSASESSSMAGRKRRLPHKDYADSRDSRLKSSTTRAAKLSAVELNSRLREAQHYSRAGSVSSASATADSAEEDSDASDGVSHDPKRRKVLKMPNERAPRPSTRREDSSKTIRAEPRSSKVGISKNDTQAQRPSSRAENTQEDKGTIRPKRLGQRR